MEIWKATRSVGFCLTYYVLGNIFTLLTIALYLAEGVRQAGAPIYIGAAFLIDHSIRRSLSAYFRETRPVRIALSSSSDASVNVNGIQNRGAGIIALAAIALEAAASYSPLAEQLSGMMSGITLPGFSNQDSAAVLILLPRIQLFRSILWLLTGIACAVITKQLASSIAASPYISELLQRRSIAAVCIIGLLLVIGFGGLYLFGFNLGADGASVFRRYRLSPVNYTLYLGILFPAGLVFMYAGTIIALCQRWLEIMSTSHAGD